MSRIEGCECPKCELEGIRECGCECPTCVKDEERLKKEIEKMSEEDIGHPYKVGDKAKIINQQWNPDKGLPDPHGVYKVLAVHGSSGDFRIYLGFPRDCGIGSYCEDQKDVPSKFHGKFNGSWINIEDVEKSEMKEKLLESGKEMGVAATAGVKLALASQGAEFGYQQLSKMMQKHLGFTKQQMESPLVKEVVKTLTPVIFHMAATVGEGIVPQADKVKQGCELLIQDQSRAHAVTIIRMFGPMMVEMASVMDPSTLQQRVTEELIATGRINTDVETEANTEAETEAEETAEEKEVAQATA